MSVLGVPEGGEHPGPVIGCPLGPPNDTIGRSVGTRRSSAFRTTRWHGSWQLHYTQSSSISRNSVRRQIQVCWYLCWYEVFKPQHTVSIMRKQINLSPGPLVVIGGRRFEFLNPVPSESGDSGLHVSRRCDAATSPSGAMGERDGGFALRTVAARRPARQRFLGLREASCAPEIARALASDVAAAPSYK